MFSNTNWGFGAAEIWSNVLLIVGSLSGFLLLGICIYMAPSVMFIIRQAAVYRERGEFENRPAGWKRQEFSGRVRDGTDWKGRRKW
jgi:hypothetical protein